MRRNTDATTLLIWACLVVLLTWLLTVIMNVTEVPRGFDAFR